MIFTLDKVGTDAEVFIRDRHTSQPHPIVGLLGGTKSMPDPIPELGDGFCYQEDNVMAEFNVPPASSPQEFSANLCKILANLRKKMYDSGYSVAIVPSMHFKEEQLMDPQAQTFGCEPDYNAWTRDVNVLNHAHPLLETMRTAAAHIHVSYLVNSAPPITEESRQLAVRAHDLFVGVPSVLLDSDTERREIYGKAGAYRSTKYGHEYRTPSNFWIRNDKTQEWIFRQTRNALNFVSTQDGRWLLLECEKVMQQIQDAINGHNEALAANLCHEYGIQLP